MIEDAIGLEMAVETEALPSYVEISSYRFAANFSPATRRGRVWQKQASKQKASK